MDLQPIAASLCRPDPASTPGSTDGATPPPGAVVGLALGDRQWVAAQGFAQALPGAEPVPFTADTRTDSGSVTKIIATTAALMRLVDSDAVRLTDPVESIINLGLADEITVDDLLQHQAGLWEWWPLYLRATEPAAAIRTAAALPRRYPRRSGRHYSDLGFMLLGAVISTVTGMSLDRACTELSFSPYGLRATRFRSPAPGAEVAASSYGDVVEQTMINTGSPYPVTGSVGDFAGWRDHPLIGEVNDGNSFHAHHSCAGHAGVFTTAGDLLRFGRVMLNSLAGNGPIGQPTARRFTSSGDDPAQGLGWRIWPTPAGPAIGHTGFPGVGFAILPEREAVLAMITNRLHVHGPASNLEHLWQQCLQAGVTMITKGALR